MNVFDSLRTRGTAVAHALGGLLALCAGTAGALAQAPTADTLLLMAAAEDGTVMLRWTPPNAASFYAGLDGGYRLERRAVGDTTWAPVGEGVYRPADFETLYAMSATDSIVPLYTMALFADSLGEASAMPPGRARERQLALDREALIGYGLVATLRSREVAVAAGLFAVDRPGPGRHEYRATALGQPALGSGRVVVDNDYDYRIPPVPELRAEWGHRTVTLDWDWPEAITQAYYEVERRGPDGAWELLTPAPLLRDTQAVFSYRDSLPTEDDAYAYRVVAHDYFHRRGPYSPVARGRSVPAIAIATPFLFRPRETLAGHVGLHWRMDASGDSAVVTGQQVLRALQPDGAYVAISPLLGPEARVWVDSVVVAVDQYYRVEAFDAYGRKRTAAHAHFVASDTVPPAPPTGLAAVVDTGGHVTLTWARNRERDLYGYRVFYSLTAAEPGTRQTDYFEYEERYADTLDLVSLPDTVYYRVVALDGRQNVSGFSAPFALGLPDVHPPGAPTLVEAVGDTLGVRVRYHASNSSDVVVHRWRKRATGTTSWFVFAEAPPDSALSTDRVFFDSTARLDIAYEYQLEVRDEAQLRGLSNVVRGERLSTGLLPAVVRLSAKPDAVARATELTWEYAPHPRLERFRVLRAREGEPLRTLTVLRPEELARKGPNRRTGRLLWRYRDETAALGADYRYAVQAEWGDGSVSRVGEGVKMDGR